jgi:hypothetical protein
MPRCIHGSANEGEEVTRVTVRVRRGSESPSTPPSRVMTLFVGRFDINAIVVLPNLRTAPFMRHFATGVIQISAGQERARCRN